MVRFRVRDTVEEIFKVRFRVRGCKDRVTVTVGRVSVRVSHRVRVRFRVMVMVRITVK